MSRQNKVNPGMYTQRGRLTQDDAARELKRQRTIGSEHTWQPSKKDHFPRLGSKGGDEAIGEQKSGDSESEDAAAETIEAESPSPVTRTTPSKKAAPAKAQAAKTAKTASARKTASKPKAAKKTTTAKAAAQRGSKKTARKAVLARNVGGGAPKARKTAKRRRS